MDIADIQDENSLLSWLKGQTADDAIQIASRSALRVFPIVVKILDEAKGRKHTLTELAILRVLLASGIRQNRMSSEVKLASTDAVSALLSAEKDALPLAAARAARAACAAADIGSFSINASFSGSLASKHAAVAASAFEGDRFIWEQVREDARLIEGGQDTMERRLWSIPPPTWFIRTDRATRAIWAAAQPDTWKFWLRWWDGVLAGTPLSWELQRDILLELTEEDWLAGPERVAARIAEIEVIHAIAATPNGEEVELNPVTGRLHLVPVTDLPSDIADYARRKIIKAVDLFGDGVDNQYRALAPDHEMLLAVVADASNLPVELFDACASASRRLNVRIRNGECPSTETDALIADYLTRIREAGADILSHDTKTQEVITARNAIIGNDALIDGAVVIRDAVALIVPVTEGVLTTALSRDADLATDPKADPADRKDASIRLSSRVLRAFKVILWVGGGTGGAIIGTKEVLGAIPEIAKLLDTPFYQQALQLIFRYLGY
jgi:hypothetical protein